jgi:hypothetical protein
MITDARIRLEGKLEELERATFAVETALASARRGHWAVVLRGLEEAGTKDVSEAVEAARKLAPLEPELERPLKRLDQARVKLANLIGARATERGLPIASLRTRVQMLIDEPVLFDRRLTTPGVGFMAVMFGGLLAFPLVTAPQHVLCPVAFFAIFMAIVFVPHFFGVRVRVARHAVVIGREVAPIAELVRVRLSRSWRKTNPYDVEMVMKTRILRARLPWVPQELCEAIESLGVEVERGDGWWL